MSELFSLVSPSLTAFNTRKSHNRCYEYTIIYLIIKGSDTYITWWLLISWSRAVLFIDILFREDTVPVTVNRNSTNGDFQKAAPLHSRT